MEVTAAITTPTDSKGLRYGILKTDQWELLRPIFDSQKAILPDQSIATAAIATDEKGAIVAMHMLQLVYHAEPQWIAEHERGRVNYLILVDLLNRLFALNGERMEYYVFAPDEKAADMCRLGQLEEMPWKVFRKRVG